MVIIIDPAFYSASPLICTIVTTLKNGLCERIRLNTTCVFTSMCYCSPTEKTIDLAVERTSHYSGTSFGGSALFSCWILMYFLCRYFCRHWVYCFTSGNVYLHCWFHWLPSDEPQPHQSHLLILNLFFLYSKWGKFLGLQQLNSWSKLHLECIFSPQANSTILSSLNTLLAFFNRK